MSPLARFEHANWLLVPHRLHHPLERWLVDGIEPRNSLFLRAVLKNDLFGAVRHANHLERAGLIALVTFIGYECPPGSFGSTAAYAEWQGIGGLRGVRDTAERVEDIYE